MHQRLTSLDGASFIGLNPCLRFQKFVFHPFSICSATMSGPALAGKQLQARLVKQIYQSLFCLVVLAVDPAGHATRGTDGRFIVRDTSEVRPDFCFLMKNLAGDGVNVEKLVGDAVIVECVHDAMGFEDGRTVSHYFNRYYRPHAKMTDAERVRYGRTGCIALGAPYSYRSTHLAYVHVELADLGDIFDDIFGYIVAKYFSDKSEYVICRRDALRRYFH
jgi:hypothetical protein